MFVYNYLIKRTNFQGDDYMKIVNRKKFMRSCLLLIGVISIIFLGMHATYSKTEITYKETYVVEGETLWSIAKEEVNHNKYYKNKDIRNAMYEIKQLNQLEDGNLKIGQKILIPEI